MACNRIQYPPNWDDIRKERLDLDDYKCQNCETKNRRLHLHHKTPLSKGGSYSLDNLITLCENCHEVEHSNFEDKVRFLEYADLRYMSMLKCWKCGRAFSHLTELVFCPNCDTFLHTENVTIRGKKNEYHYLRYGVNIDQENDYHNDEDNFIPAE